MDFTNLCQDEIDRLTNNCDDGISECLAELGIDITSLITAAPADAEKCFLPDYIRSCTHLLLLSLFISALFYFPF